MTDPELRNPLAFYYDELGERHDMKASELADDKKFEIADKASERKQLWDPSETIEFIVKPKSVNGKCRHFCSRSGADSKVAIYGLNGENEVDRKTHDRHVDTLLAELKSKTSLPWINNLNFDGYEWGKEVWRAYSPTVLARHDLYGQWKGISASLRHPAVVIEVIKSHYPEAPLLRALFDVTKLLPLVVFIEFVGRGTRFFRLERKGEPGVWARCYLWQGMAYVTTRNGTLSFTTGVSFLEAVRAEAAASSA